jgi:aspartyl-tRNA(Asn)/glutamyl-tRNA(Gln) amidotransferase subunit A
MRVSVTSPADLTISEAAGAIASGDLTPVDLTQACLERAQQVDGEIKAFVMLDADGALAQARALNDKRPNTPLHGIPIGIKDIIDVAGLATTAGSRVLEGNIALHDAPVVSRLRAAGAVIMGKTNTQEFAYGVVTYPTRNPWDRSRIPGGSSGGSAAAVAAGMCLGALGTDTAGSIRIPAALCGVSGLKPRPGIVPLDGIIPLAPSLDVCGPIARTVIDLTLMWNRLTREDVRLHSNVEELRIGISPSLFGAGEIDEDVARAVDDGVRVLCDAGARRVEVDIPPLGEWDYPRSIPLMMEALEVHRDAGWYPARSHDYTDETVRAFRYAEKVEPATLVESYKTLEDLTSRLRRAFESAEVLVQPTTPVPAPSVHDAAVADEGHRPPVTRSLTRVCGPVNWCGLAAVSVPCGMTNAGLPIGMQIIAPDEATALSVAAVYESHTEFSKRRPPI